MAITFAEILTRFRYSINDHEAPYDVDPSDSLGLVLYWTNTAVAWINREVPHLQSDDTIAGNAVKYNFDLNSDLDNNSDFMKLQLITVEGSNGRRIVRHPQGINYIRQIRSTSNGIQAGTPFHYALKGLYDIYFDAILGTGSSFKIDYWAKQPTLVAEPGEGETDSPTAPLDESWTKLIIAAVKYAAAEEIGGELGDRMLVEANLSLFGKPNDRFDIGELKRFENYIRSLGLFEEVDGIPYSELGASSPQSAINDYTETDPWA